VDLEAMSQLRYGLLVFCHPLVVLCVVAVDMRPSTAYATLMFWRIFWHAGPRPLGDEKEEEFLSNATPILFDSQIVPPTTVA